MKALLVVLFLIDGQWQYINGLFPLILEDAETCEIRREKAQIYFEENSAFEFKLNCYGILPGS